MAFYNISPGVRPGRVEPVPGIGIAATLLNPQEQSWGFCVLRGRRGKVKGERGRSERREARYKTQDSRLKTQDIRNKT